MQPLIEIWLGQELFTKNAKACWYVVNLLLCDPVYYFESKVVFVSKIYGP